MPASSNINFEKQDLSSYLLFDDIVMEQLEPITFNASLCEEALEAYGMDIERGIYQLKSFTYELPTNSFVLLSHVVDIFEKYKAQTEHCKFFSPAIQTYIVNGFLDDLPSFFSEGVNFEIENEDIENEKSFKRKYQLLILVNKKMNDLPLYRSLIAKRQDLMNFCELTQLTPVKCLNNFKLNKLISEGNNPYYLLNDQLDFNKRLAIINAIKGITGNKWDLIIQNATDLVDPIDWHNIIQRILHVKLYELCLPCLGKPAFQKDSYFRISKSNNSDFVNFQLSHTELEFFVDSGVNLTIKDGQVCFINLSNNPSYMKHYADQNYYLYNDFADELKVMGNHMGLTFDICNHDLIVLSQESSELFRKKGLVDLIELMDYLYKPRTFLRGTLFEVNPNDINMQQKSTPSLLNPKSLNMG